MCKDTTLKYNIKPRLRKLAVTDYNAAMKNLPGILNISRQTFSKLINCKQTDDYEPRSIILVRLASFFKVEVRELYTSKPEKVSITDVHIFNENQLADDLNLTA